MRKVVILASLAAFPMSSLAIAGGESTDIWEGVFTEEQVERGNEAYDRHCVVCHSEDLGGVDDETPSLTEPAFRWSWVGKTIADRFERTQTTMPLNEPGSLDGQVYADIISYILHFNGYPVGEVELTADLERMEEIEITLEDDD